jgi:tRNA nucleotidyltransferase/poly(A) polymerase
MYPIFDGIEICEQLQHHGYQALLVGGTVRDLLLNLPINDIDIATDATPQEVMNNLGKDYHVYPLGEKFGTVAINMPNSIVEITTYRSESDYTDNRHPDKVKFETSIEKDLMRRDFTINAIAFDPINKVFVDPYDGMGDLFKYRTIKTVGNPDERFSEDPLRMMRMVRFSIKFNFPPHGETLLSCTKLAFKINLIPAERIKEELFKILELSDGYFALSMLKGYGLMRHILPEIIVLNGMPQPEEHHDFDVYYHTLTTVNAIDCHKPLLRFAGLMHDVGKNELESNPPPYYPAHEHKGAEIAEVIMNRLKLSTDEREYIHFLIKHHMDAFHHKEMDNRATRRYLNKVGDVPQQWFIDLFDLIKADIVGTGRESNFEVLNQFRDKVTYALDHKTDMPFSRKDLAINGNDLMEMGIEPSPRLGKILDVLLQEVIENPVLNTKAHLIRRIKPINDWIIELDNP